jgi:hypothetical protein
MALGAGRQSGERPARPRRQADLEQSERHIAIAKKQIGRQKELIKGLAQAGHEIDLPVSLLHAMEHSLRVSSIARSA